MEHNFFVQENAVLDEITHCGPSHLQGGLDLLYILSGSDCLHYHRVIELGICLSGEGVVFVDGERFDYRAGDTELVLPYQKHIVFSTGEQFSRWKWVFLDPHLFVGSDGDRSVVCEEILREKIGLCGIFGEGRRPDLSALIRYFVTEISEERDERERLLPILYEFFLRKLEAASDGLPKLHVKTGPGSPKIAAILSKIDRLIDGNEPIPIRALAKEFGYSYSYFNVFFRNNIGTTPKNYILGQKVRRAEHYLLNTDLSVSEIAERLGFADPSGLYRSFLSLRRISPTEFRQRWQGKNPPEEAKRDENGA